MHAYVDSPAIIKRYVTEDWSDLVTGLFNGADLIATSPIAQIEVSAALFRMSTENRISAEHYADAIAAFQSDWHDLVIVSLDEEVLTQAARLATRQLLKTLDLIHLAAALIWKRDLGEAVTLATFDLQLWRAAARVALPTWPPDLPALCAARRAP